MPSFRIEIEPQNSAFQALFLPPNNDISLSFGPRFSPPSHLQKRPFRIRFKHQMTPLFILFLAPKH